MRILKELHGGENNEKVYQVQQMLMSTYTLSLKFHEALLISQKNITIYRAINGDPELEDEQVAGLISQCGLLQWKMQKHDDAVRQLDESIRILKKLGNKNPEVSKTIERLQKDKETILADKKKGGSQAGAQALSKGAAN